MTLGKHKTTGSSAQMQAEPYISVIICTKDRCDLLQRTLELLAKQALPEGKTFEIVTVDNNSSDATSLIVKRMRDSLPVPLLYVFEKEPGLSRARNRGVRESSGGILAFTDDDVILPDNWLWRISALASRTPPPACITGPVEIHQDSHPALRSSYTPGQKLFRYPVEPWDVGRGNNMAFDRRCLLRAGDFDTRLGAGTAAGSGEDTDMFYRIMKLGGEILFDPELSVYHDHGRHDSDAIKRICRNYAVGGTAFLIKHIIRFDVFALKLLYWKLESFRLALKRTQKDQSYSPSEREVKKIYLQGYFAGMLRGTINLFKKS